MGESVSGSPIFMFNKLCTSARIQKGAGSLPAGFSKPVVFFIAFHDRKIGGLNTSV
jgi:hypothetical protein